MSNILLHEGQSEIFADLFVRKEIAHAVAACSRGWGKSYFAAVCATHAVFELLSLKAEVPNKNVYIIAPTYGQVTDIYHPLLADAIGLDKHCLKHSKDLGRFWFPKGVELRLLSYEAVARMRGHGAYFVVNDEVRDWTKGIGLKEAWQSIIKPCITTRWSAQNAARFNAPSRGRSLTISTTKGYDYFYDMYNMQESDPSFRSYHFDYTESPYLDPEEIEREKGNMDPFTFRREFRAVFEESGNSVFYMFKRDLHVSKDIAEIQDWEDIHIGIDFNVGIQASSIGVIRGGQVHFLDEIQGQPDTESLAIAIDARYGRRSGNLNRKIFVYPDPTGKSRKTSAPVGITDLSILRSYGFVVLAHSRSPGIADSVNCVNRMLQTMSGVVRIYVHPRCVGIITSLERTVWVDNNPNTATICKKAGVEHYSDGIRYLIQYCFPIVGSVGSVASSDNF
jgi:hypothetical protein